MGRTEPGLMARRSRSWSSTNAITPTGPGEFISSYFLSAVVGHPEGMALSRCSGYAGERPGDGVGGRHHCRGDHAALGDDPLSVMAVRRDALLGLVSGCKWQSEDTADRPAAMTAMTKHCLGTARPVLKCAGQNGTHSMIPAAGGLRTYAERAAPPGRVVTVRTSCTQHLTDLLGPVRRSILVSPERDLSAHGSWSGHVTLPPTPVLSFDRRTRLVRIPGARTGEPGWECVRSDLVEALERGAG